MNRIINCGLVAIVAATLAACGSDDSPVAGNAAGTAVSPEAAVSAAASASAKNDAVVVAQGQPALSILVEAVVAADLAGTLSGPGPLTIFAPTNDAFSALLAELNITKDQLLADKALLTQVLTYHVLDSEVKVADVPVGQAIASLSGAVFKVSSPAQGGLVINDGRGRTANITATDIMADNAVIHLIDRVILPADKTIVQQAQALPGFSILVQAVLAADLADTLSGAGPFTVFAPTDTAFAALLAELNTTADALLADKALLTRVLTYHVVPGLVLAGAVPLDTDIVTVEGNTLRIDGSLAITDGRARTSNIVATDVLASNGVIHVIDRVLLPH